MGAPFKSTDEPEEVLGDAKEADLDFGESVFGAPPAKGFKSTGGTPSGSGTSMISSSTDTMDDWISILSLKTGSSKSCNE